MIRTEPLGTDRHHQRYWYMHVSVFPGVCRGGICEQRTARQSAPSLVAHVCPCCAYCACVHAAVYPYAQVPTPSSRGCTARQSAPPTVTLCMPKCPCHAFVHAAVIAVRCVCRVGGWEQLPPAALTHVCSCPPVAPVCIHTAVPTYCRMPGLHSKAERAFDNDKCVHLCPSCALVHRCSHCRTLCLWSRQTGTAWVSSTRSSSWIACSAASTDVGLGRCCCIRYVPGLQLDSSLSWVACAVPGTKLPVPQRSACWPSACATATCLLGKCMCYSWIACLAASTAWTAGDAATHVTCV
jgi:hypothetical protein